MLLYKVWIQLKHNFTPYQKCIFRGASTNGKLSGIRVLNAKKGTILKKINVSFIVHFWFGKYSLVTFWKYSFSFDTF